LSARNNDGHAYSGGAAAARVAKGLPQTLGVAVDDDDAREVAVSLREYEEQEHMSSIPATSAGRYI
jgi:hypothetical protein